MSPSYLTIRNGQSVALDTIPLCSNIDFRNAVIAMVRKGARISALFGVPLSACSGNECTHDTKTIRIFALVAYDHQGHFRLGATDVQEAWPSLTPECPQAQLFERAIFEQTGVRPEGHPWLKPVRFPPPSTQGATFPEIGKADFLKFQGLETHEVAVGPVHAGVIEPGHFRFLCHGEQVYHLEIALGYQHRGIEKAVIGGPDRKTSHYMETLAGDTTIGHALTYCRLIEAFGKTPIPARAQALRGIALELERLANHTGDLGALAGDIGYLPTSSYCGRLRGDILNLTALLCGNRFGRGFISPGSVRFDVEPERIELMIKRMKLALRDISSAIELLWSAPSVMARFEETGVLSHRTCTDLGLVGPTARACGIELDIRFDHPFGIYTLCQIPVSTWHSGDVFARAYVRWLEIQRSAAFVIDQLERLPTDGIGHESTPIQPCRFAVALTEGWRGEICHSALTDSNGRFAYYNVVDPSFHNWMGLAVAMRHQQISDFPLCNKSFNLSYCGHDL